MKEFFHIIFYCQLIDCKILPYDSTLSLILSHVTIEDGKTYKEDENLSTTMVMIETVHPRWNLICFPRQNHEIKIFRMKPFMPCRQFYSFLRCVEMMMMNFVAFFHSFFTSEWIRGWNVSDYTATPIILFTHWRFIPLYAHRQRPFIRSLSYYIIIVISIIISMKISLTECAVNSFIEFITFLNDWWRWEHKDGFGVVFIKNLLKFLFNFLI